MTSQPDNTDWTPIPPELTDEDCPQCDAPLYRDVMLLTCMCLRCDYMCDEWEPTDAEARFDERGDDDLLPLGVAA